MTVVSRAVMVAVMTEARTTDVELKGHAVTDVGQEGQASLRPWVAVLAVDKVVPTLCHLRNFRPYQIIK